MMMPCVSVRRIACLMMVLLLSLMALSLLSVPSSLCDAAAIEDEKQPQASPASSKSPRFKWIKKLRRKGSKNNIDVDNGLGENKETDGKDGETFKVVIVDEEQLRDIGVDEGIVRYHPCSIEIM